MSDDSSSSLTGSTYLQREVAGCGGISDSMLSYKKAMYVGWRTEDTLQIAVYLAEASYFSPSLEGLNPVMKSKINSARLAPANQVFTPLLQMMMRQRTAPPVPLLVNRTQSAHERSAQLRRVRIAVVAYTISEGRGFIAGHEAEDWVFAQAQVDLSDARSFEGW
jgi:hypothetical protein